MPRNSSSHSRSRSNSDRHKRRNKPKRSDSSDYGHQRSKFVKTERGGEKIQNDKSGLRLVKGANSDLRQESDIKNHIIFENIKLNKKDDESSILEKIKREISKSVGPLEHVTKISKG